MATIIGGIATSHIPAIGKAIAKGLQDQDYWKPFFDGVKPVHAWLRETQPDVAIVIYNDHGLNFFLDNMPTFAVGAAAEYRNADEGWGLPVAQPIPGDPELSWHLIESLVNDEFDITTCQEMLVDHGLVVPMNLLWSERGARPIPVIPISVNTVQFPLPTPARCFKLGNAIARGIQSIPKDLRVVVMGTGGLSHQLDGERAGFINKEFDQKCLDLLAGDVASLSRLSTVDLVRLAGAQGVEFLNWLVMRGALTGKVTEIHRNYCAPISNTAGAVMVLENQEARHKLKEAVLCP